MIDQNCFHCRFWYCAPQQRDDAAPGEFVYAPANRMACRRRAPFPPLLVRVGGGGSSGDPDPIWPLTYASDWCGEFESYSDPTVEEQR